VLRKEEVRVVKGRDTGGEIGEVTGKNSRRAHSEGELLKHQGVQRGKRLSMKRSQPYLWGIFGDERK